MHRDVPDVDWKRFRALREVALERFCERLLDLLASVLQNTSVTAHQRYLDACELLNDQNRIMAAAFDDPRRSRMVQQLALMSAHSVLAPEDLAPFTARTRRAVEGLAAAANRRLTTA